MAMSAIQTNVCTKLDLNLRTFVNATTIARTAVSGIINSVKTLISGLQYSTINELQQLSSDIDTDLNDTIPNLDGGSEFNEMLNMINSCSFLKTDKTLGNPLSLVRTLDTSLRDDSQGVFDQLAAGIGEFSVAKLMDALFVRYATEFNFGQIVPDIYKIIDCIDSLCPGIDITSTILIFENNVEKLYLSINGTFEKSRFFSDLGLTGDQILKINIALTSYENMRDRISNSISDGVSYAKSLL